jgi:hypothetical protein
MRLVVHIDTVTRGMEISDGAARLSLHAAVIGVVLHGAGIKVKDVSTYKNYPVYGLILDIAADDHETMARAENLIRNEGYTIVSE